MKCMFVAGGTLRACCLLLLHLCLYTYFTTVSHAQSGVEAPQNVQLKTGSQAIPNFAQHQAAATPSDGVLYDRHGAVLATQRLHLNVRRLDWVTLSSVSPALIEALLVAEDQRFFVHSGVDWQGVVGALWDNLSANLSANLNEGKSAKTRGASSISMQVAALLDEALTRGAQGRSVAKKWDQMQAALALEKQWSKAQILEAYFNSIFYRGELQGLSAASWGLFDKAPSGLDKAESAILAALIRAPNAKPAQVAQRACGILKTTRSGQRCDVSGIAITVSAASLKPQAVRNDALHVAQQLLSTTVPRVTSSLDAVLQRQVQRMLRDQLASIVAQGAEDGAAVVLDNATGEVLAYVGSSGAFSQAAQVDAAQAPRQAGSTLKPLIYGLAIEQQRLTAASVLDDNAVSIPTAAGLYTPHNYDEQFIGDVSVRKALGSSLNIPAVRALALLKPDALHSQMRRMGFSTLHADPEHYGLSLALGSADVKLIELTNAYRSLANGGLHSAWRYTPLSANTASSVAVPSVRVFSSSAAWVVGHILSDNAARAHTFGFDSVLATPFWTAVKTGTSKDMRDNWCIGYSQRYTVGVWVGQAAGQAMRNVSGVAGAAPIWADVMHTLHRNTTSKPPTMPAGVVAQAIRYSSDLEPARTEYFVAGTQPSPPSPPLPPPHSPTTAAGLAGTPNAVAVIQLESKQTAPRITQPVNGSLMAWDPDIPAGQQGVRLKHSGAEQGHYWTVNGQRLDSALLLWQRDGVKGKTVLTLDSADGTVLDTVRFELRGR